MSDKKGYTIVRCQWCAARTRVKLPGQEGMTWLGCCLDCYRKALIALIDEEELKVSMEIVESYEPDHSKWGHI